MIFGVCSVRSLSLKSEDGELRREARPPDGGAAPGRDRL
jgi:hypothetical protein